jgi:hypothetical protein
MPKRPNRRNHTKRATVDEFDDRIFEIIVFAFLLSTAAIATGAIMALLHIMPPI